QYEVFVEPVPATNARDPALLLIGITEQRPIWGRSGAGALVISPITLVLLLALGVLPMPWYLSREERLRQRDLVRIGLCGAVTIVLLSYLGLYEYMRETANETTDQALGMLAKSLDTDLSTELKESLLQLKALDELVT